MIAPRHRQYFSASLASICHNFAWKKQNVISVLDGDMVSIIKWSIPIAAILALLLWLWRSNAQPLPQIGASAPDFTLIDQTGVARSSSEYRGRWLITYFYPKDDTPGCTKQACTFRDGVAQLQGLDAQVVGISVDTSASHAQFAKKYSLPFALLADTQGKVAERYGSLRNFGPIKFAKRNTFLIDPQGKIAKVYIGVDPELNVKQVVDDLKSLQNK
jgi:thioredoxin-dependent peroxiredoxin